MKKPDVIIISPLIWNEDGEVIDSNLSHMGRTIAQAQLDDTYEKMLAEHQQVVREIFEEVEKYLNHPMPTGVQFFAMPVRDLQSLKDRFLKDKKSKVIG